MVDQFGDPIDYGRSITFKSSLVEKLSFLPEPALMLTRAFTEVMPFDESIRITSEAEKGEYGERILSGYWGIAQA